jgi:glycosyltransferase involved in cell wall biosynthesis
LETLKFLMTTTFYPPYHIGGDAIHVKYLAEELVKRGHEVQVFHSLDAYRSKKKNLPIKSETRQICVHTVDEPFNLSSYAAYILGNSPSIIKKFDKLLYTLKPDVVHHHNISLLGYGILEKKGPYVNLLTTHDFWLVCQLHSLLRKGSEICEGYSCLFCALKCGKIPQTWRFLKSFKTDIKSIDLLISPSDYFRKKLAQRIDVKSVTLPNFAPHPPIDVYQVDYSDYFLFVGALEIQKGILDLLELFKQIGYNAGLKLVIVGDGSLRNHVIEFIRRNSLNTFVYCIGSIENKKELYSLYANALAVVMPSILVENAPLVALEAFSVGCPVIASNIGGLPEIMEKVDKKLIFNNINELRNILLSFTRSDYPPTRIKKVYEKNFSPEIYVDKYIALINALKQS